MKEVLRLRFETLVEEVIHQVSSQRTAYVHGLFKVNQRYFGNLVTAASRHHSTIHYDFMMMVMLQKKIPYYATNHIIPDQLSPSQAVPSASVCGTRLRPGCRHEPGQGLRRRDPQRRGYGLFGLGRRDRFCGSTKRGGCRVMCQPM